MSPTIQAPKRLNRERNFKRIASFPVCSQIEANCHTDVETSAEIVTASADGNTLIYTDSPNNSVGFVDITNPAQPIAAGTISLSGEPTSVTVSNGYALVAVNTSADFINTSGQLDIVDITSKQVIRSIDLGGQPDSIAASPDGQYAAIAIENERDEDLGDGEPAQAPAGFLTILDMQGDVANWSTRTVDLTGVADLFPDDAEPEYVDINAENTLILTLQENNHLVLVNLADGSITNHFTAGTVDLTAVDAQEEKKQQGAALISLTDTLPAVPREPDGVTWINSDYFATADEGDLYGGSRGFTIFDKDGTVQFNSGNSLDHLAVQLGHYPDDRSGNKGNEPENVDFGQYGDQATLVVASERSSLLFVYDVTDPLQPSLKQSLPAGGAPEGVLTMPARNLLIAASEADDRGDKMRSVINIYRYEEGTANYPTIQSASVDGTPIAWGAMSGLAADSDNSNILYAVEDSFYLKNRIFKIDTAQSPALITEAIKIQDNNDVLAGLSVASVGAELADDDETRKSVFDSADLAAMINADKTINVDPEGIAVASDGGFWVALEGSGTVADADSRPINSLDLILKTTAEGVIEKVISLPEAQNAKQVRFGFEGVAEYNNQLYVAFQRAWGEDENPQIGIYNLDSESWTFVQYPLDAPESQNGGWVGLSDISSLNNGQFLLIERDNQGGPDAAIKRLYKIDLSNPTEGEVLSKTLVRDLMTDLKATGALVYEKIEGLAVTTEGNVFIINDNDGVDDNSGETQLMNLGQIL